MTLEEAKQSILDHIKEKGSIQGYVHNSLHRDVLEFLEKEMPEISLPLERIYVLMFGHGFCADCGEPTTFKSYSKGYVTYCEECGIRQGKKLRKPIIEIPLICEQCGKTFIRKTKNEKELEKPKVRFCSKHCSQLWNYAHRDPEVEKARLEKTKKTNLKKYGNELVVN